VSTAATCGAVGATGATGPAGATGAGTTGATGPAGATGAGGGGAKRYLNKPAANITRAGTTFAAFSTAWQITSVVVAAGQNVYLAVSAYTRNSTTTNDVGLALFRDSTQIASAVWAQGASWERSLVWVDENPGAGTYTYEVRGAAFVAGTLTVYQSNPTTDTIGGSSVFVAEVYTP
jgi:hypothetical protein